MKVLKNILITLGTIFLLFVALAIFLFSSSSEFKERNQGFVENYTKEFSQKWDVKSVSDKSTNGLLASINTPNGKQAISFFSSLGKLKSISDIELANYSSNAGSPDVGVFTFKAEFENGKALVKVTIHESDDVIKVHGFNIDPIGELTSTKEVIA